MGFDFSFMMVALKAALKYTPTTLVLAFVPLVAGIITGTLIALARFFKVRILGQLCGVFVVVLKGTPAVLILLIAYFGVIQSFDAFAQTLGLQIRSKDIDLIYVALIAFSLFASANISESIRGALSAVDSGQYEAAYSIGLTRTDALKRIILPQALPVALPMLTSNIIGLVKASSLAFMITVTDLMNGALITATANYKFLEAYVASAIVYWVICIVIEKASYTLEKRITVFRKEGTA